MKCAWKELMDILPLSWKQQVDSLGRETAQELRLRQGMAPVLVMAGGRRTLEGMVTEEQLKYVVNMACRYSPWTASTSASGYLTAPGGHRIGLCGDAVIKDGVMTGFRTVRSLNIRVARDFPGIGAELAVKKGNLLLLGPPGSGKTTLLRDLIRLRAQRENVAVVDERGELFPASFALAQGMDVITGCGKAHGIDTVLRTMGPDTIAVDEITAQSDCDALVQAGWCGVKLLATAHAASRHDLLSRPVYRPIVESRLFDTVVVLQSDKSFRTERMAL